MFHDPMTVQGKERKNNLTEVVRFNVSFAGKICDSCNCGN